MRVLFTHQPAAGHFHPLVPLARALQAAGHQVAFACGRPFCSHVQAAGFTSWPAGLDDFRFGRARADRMVGDVIAIGRQWAAELIVRDTLEFGGCIAAERLGIPHASVQVGAHCPPEPPWDLIGAELTGLRARYGLSPVAPFDMLYRHLHLSFAPPSYQRLGAFVPRTTEALRLVIDDRSAEASLPPWMERLAPRPTIYASLGTIAGGHDARALAIFRTLLVGLRELHLNLILTVGHDVDPAEFGPQPPHVHIERYVPQSLLLPRCDLVVTHGGCNTVLAALWFGLPLVVIPLFADQPENARRCRLLGAGQVIAPDALTPELLRRMVANILQTPTYRESARRLHDEMAAQPSLEHGVGLLVALARRGG